METEFKEYAECRSAAQKLANDTGADYGVYKNILFGYYYFFRLPLPQNRYGFEARCEVVMCTDSDKRDRMYLTSSMVFVRSK